jgi:GGDEF domain-containing protein
LPGNVSFERRAFAAHRFQAARSPILYIVLDLISKAFNDYYGYAKGDEAIKRRAPLDQRAGRPRQSAKISWGTSGGDRLVVITSPDAPT